MKPLQDNSDLTAQAFAKYLGVELENQDADAIRARHAQVVPAFNVRFLRRSLEWRATQVQVSELLSWRRPSDLSAASRADLRKQIVKRLRPRGDIVWKEKVGVALPSDWQSRVTRDDYMAVKRLDVPEKSLEHWTLREVKVALAVSLERTLGLLARLESIEWVPVVVAPRLMVSELGKEDAQPLLCGQQLADLCEQALRLTWLDTVGRDDIRFGYSGRDTLTQWITERRAIPTPSGAVERLLKGLLLADGMTAEQEAADLAQRAVLGCIPKPGSVTAAHRWIEIFLRRCLAPSGDGRTLAEVGQEHGITRERVRQICDAMESSIRMGSVATPALDRVLAAAQRAAPSTAADMDVQLRKFMGEGTGIESLVSWARILGRQDLQIRCERVVKSVRGDLVRLTMIHREEEQPWVAVMLALTGRDTYMFGCSNILRVAGLLAIHEGLTPDRETVELTLKSVTGFRWLDRKSGWFALGESWRCSIANRIQKIVAVAEVSVGADEIAQALAGDDHLIYRDEASLGQATPPVHVLRELLSSWPWLKRVQQGRFVAAEPIDLIKVLSPSERFTVDLIGKRDGVACLFEIREELHTKLGVTPILVMSMLGSSAVIVRIEKGLYRVRGRAMGGVAVEAARRRFKQRVHPHLISSGDDDIGHCFNLRVTEAALRNEQYSVPTTFASQMYGSRHQVLDCDDQAIGVVSVNSSGALRGINILFPEAQIGDVLRVQLTPHGLKVRLNEQHEQQ